MAEINEILSYANYEIIRDRISYILAIELANQKALNVAELALEQAKPTPNQDLIDLYELNISCIPGKVWLERFLRPQPSEYPMVNVVFTGAPLNEGSSHTLQNGVDRYIIECYQDAKSSENRKGDELASLKLHRVLAICRAILMDRNYVRLGFNSAPYIVGSREVRDLMIAQPVSGAENSHHAIYGKIDLLVKTTEVVPDLTGVDLNISYTEMKIYDSDLGYYFQVGT